MLLHYRIPPKGNKRKRKNSNDIKRPQMTSKDTNEIDKLFSKKAETKNNLADGDPNDVNLSHRWIFIENVFCSPKNG